MKEGDGFGEKSLQFWSEGHFAKLVWMNPFRRPRMGLILPSGEWESQQCRGCDQSVSYDLPVLSTSRRG